MKLGGQGALQNLSFVASSGTGAWPEDHPDHLAAIVARRTEIGGFGGYGDQALQTIPALVGGGVLAQFPDLHFLFVESGARWLLNVMDTMDEAWHVGPGVNEVNRTFFRPDGTKVMQFQPDELNLAWPHPLKPSEYVRRQVHATFQDDWIALRNRVHTGIEPLIWGNDYAHNEGCWPRSVEAVEIQCEKAGLTDAEREAIFGGNCARLLKAAEPVTAK
jgi:predicted TIM-barrel fold metal-dependent hydrolase